MVHPGRADHPDHVLRAVPVVQAVRGRREDPDTAPGTARHSPLPPQYRPLSLSAAPECSPDPESRLVSASQVAGSHSQSVGSHNQSVESQSRSELCRRRVLSLSLGPDSSDHPGEGYRSRDLGSDSLVKWGPPVVGEGRGQGGGLGSAEGVEGVVEGVRGHVAAETCLHTPGAVGRNPEVQGRPPRLRQDRNRRHPPEEKACEW